MAPRFNFFLLTGAFLFVHFSNVSSKSQTNEFAIIFTIHTGTNLTTDDVGGLTDNFYYSVYKAFNYTDKHGCLYFEGYRSNGSKVHYEIPYHRFSLKGLQNFTDIIKERALTKTPTKPNCTSGRSDRGDTGSECYPLLAMYQLPEINIHLYYLPQIQDIPDDDNNKERIEKAKTILTSLKDNSPACHQSDMVVVTSRISKRRKGGEPAVLMYYSYNMDDDPWDQDPWVNVGSSFYDGLKTVMRQKLWPAVQELMRKCNTTYACRVQHDDETSCNISINLKKSPRSGYDKFCLNDDGYYENCTKDNTGQSCQDACVHTLFDKRSCNATCDSGYHTLELKNGKKHLPTFKGCFKPEEPCRNLPPCKPFPAVGVGLVLFMFAYALFSGGAATAYVYWTLSKRGDKLESGSQQSDGVAKAAVVQAKAKEEGSPKK